MLNSILKGLSPLGRRSSYWTQLWKSLEPDLLTRYTGERSDYDLTEVSGLDAKIIPGMLRFSSYVYFAQTQVDLSGETDVDITTYIYRPLSTDTLAVGQYTDATHGFLIHAYGSKLYVVIRNATYNYANCTMSGAGVFKIRVKYNGGGATNADKIQVWVDDVSKTLTFSGTIPVALPSIANKFQMGGAGGASFNTDGAIGETSIKINGVLTNKWTLDNEVVTYADDGGSPVYNFVDFIGDKHGILNAVPSYYYISGYGSKHCMEKGYSVYYRYVSNPTEKIAIVPHGEDGLIITIPTVVANYTLKYDVAGSLNKFNLAPAIVDFDPTASGDVKLINFKRSDTTVFAAAARAVGTYYTAGLPYQFHSSQLNRYNITEWYNADYKWKVFFNASPNSSYDTTLLNEIYNFATDKTGNNLQAVLRQCNEHTIVTDSLVLNRQYENREIYYELDSVHTDCARDLLVFGGYNGQIYLSKDGGETYPYTKAVAGLTVVQFAYIWDNGNITFATLNKLYLATENLATVTEVIPKDYKGDDFIASTVSTGESFCGVQSPDDPVYINGTEMLVLGNYGNFNYACPSNAFYSKDKGVSFKTFYGFGQNAAYKVSGNLVGDPTNAIICRHIHSINYDIATGYWWIQTGDQGSDPNYEVHWIKVEYDILTDTITPTVVNSGDDTSWWKVTGMQFYNGYHYWASDMADHQGIYKCLYADVSTPDNFIKVIIPYGVLLNLKLNDGVLISSPITVVNQLILSKDYGVTSRRTTLKYITDLLGDTNLFRISNKNTNGWYRCDPYVSNAALMYSGPTLWFKLK